MHNVIAHRLVCSQSLIRGTMSNFSLVYIRGVMPNGMEYPSGQLGSTVTAVSPPSSFLCSLVYWLMGWVGT